MFDIVNVDLLTIYDALLLFFDSALCLQAFSGVLRSDLCCVTCGHR